MKKCSKCHVIKPFQDFDDRAGSKDGKRGQCKACLRARLRDTYRRNPEPKLTRQRERRQCDTERVRDVERRSYGRHRSERRQSNQQWNARNDAGYRAHIALNNAVALGKIARPSTCEKCGKVGHVDGHHADYDKPLDVVWLCRSCHVRLTREEAQSV